MRPSIALAVALAVVGASYLNALDVGFLWDDHTLIEENPLAHTLSPPWEYFTRSYWAHPFWFSESGGYYRPLVSFTLALDWVRGGGRPFAFHVTNVVLHLAACALLYLLARRLGAAAWAAALATALFGAFPRLTESVTWVVGRTDVLAALFTLAALGTWRAAALRPPVRALATGALFFLALTSKEVALSGLLAVGVALVAQALRDRKLDRGAWLELLPSLLAVAAWAALRQRSGQGTAPVARPPAHALDVLGTYLELLASPWTPSAFIGDAQVAEPAHVALGALLLAGVLALTAVPRLRPPPERLGLLWGALFGLLLVSVVDLRLFTTASDRFLYLPLAFALAAAAVPASRAPPRAALLVGAPLLLSFAAATGVRNAAWSNELVFWQRSAAAAAPTNGSAKRVLGDALLDVHRDQEALALFERALGQSPQTHGIVLSIASVRSQQGDHARALALLDQLQADLPGYKRAAYARVKFLARALDFDGAARAAAQAQERFGNDPLLDAQLAEYASVRDALGKLPPPADGEPLEVAAARAEALDRLGDLSGPRRLYRRVAFDPNAPAPLAQRAVGWLVLKDELPGAQAALDRARGLGLPAGTVQGLEALLAERLGDTPAPSPR